MPIPTPEELTEATNKEKKMSEVQKWGDSQQYHAEPHKNFMGPTLGVMPKVHLLWMTPDPLGAVASMSEMYKGRVVRDLSDLTDEQRMSAFEDVQKTHLTAPLEAIKMHFMIEGVDRSFTHQLVRQRTAVYAQESLRFAVPGELREATSLPPSLMGTTGERDSSEETYGTSQEEGWRQIWDNANNVIDAAYHALVETGMPAEEARGLLPHATATRLNYVTDLRNLVDHAGNRLCTQAQFHWRIVFSQIVQVIRDYAPTFEFVRDDGYAAAIQADWREAFGWQFEALADSKLFRPVCFQQGKCPFKASFDRACSIRDRVDAYAENGIPSSEWEQGALTGDDYIKPIRIEEWLANPHAARA